ncbi:MAG TPA: crosslink repair DNA glycosylase YcaQ family protein [Thermoanaerobaculia bacterium]|nr:crosslink repair DNA glycosylase YcaQ family protein [Thermoanaerobaculia bacterium]
MPTITPALRLTRDQLRRVCVAAQGLAPAPGQSVVGALEETGFVRTLGGVDVYIAVRARVPGLRRDDLDGTVEAQQAQIIPAARGCMYLVPRRDVPISLRVASLLSRTRDERDHEKAGVRPGEVEEVAKAALASLRERGPMTTDGLRKAMPAGTLRSLGEQGKKVGISSALPGALRRLEFEGLVERALENRRLDSERYLWRAVAVSPFEGVKLPDDPIDLYAGMARIFFHAAGLATQKDFAGWIGIPQRDAKAAIERLSLLPVEVEGSGDLHYLQEDRRGLLEESGDAIALLSFEDNLIHLHGGPAFLVDEAHHGAEVPSWGMGRPSTLGEARHLSLRSFVTDGKIAGFWEYDPDTREIVVRPFAPLAAKTRKKVDEAAADLSRFLAEDLGHGRSFSLDTDEELRKRTAKIREG